MKDKRVDELLEARGQQFVREVVRSLPEDTASMQWRSELNQKLKRLGRRPIFWAAGWRAMVGLACAGAFAVVLMIRIPTSPPKASAADEQAVFSTMVAEHRNSVQASDVAMIGSVNPDTERSSSTRADNESENDLDNL